MESFVKDHPDERPHPFQDHFLWNHACSSCFHLNEPVTMNHPMLRWFVFDFKGDLRTGLCLAHWVNTSIMEQNFWTVHFVRVLSRCAQVPFSHNLYWAHMTLIFIDLGIAQRPADPGMAQRDADPGMALRDLQTLACMPHRDQMCWPMHGT